METPREWSRYQWGYRTVEFYILSSELKILPIELIYLVNKASPGTLNKKEFNLKKK